MPKIVVLDGHTLNPGDNPWDPVSELGELDVYERTPREEIVARAHGARIILTNKTPLEAQHFEQLPDLQFVSVLATGFNNIDLHAAREHDVVVSNVPEYGTDSVAQHVFALILALSNNVAIHDLAISRGEWNDVGDFTFWRRSVVELAGLTLGIVGLGRIGSRVARIADGFGMEIIAHTPSDKPAPDIDSFRWVELDELFETADIVSLNCAMDETNRSMVDADRLRSMKESAFLVNTARGGLVVAADLARALEEGWIAGAGIDVFDEEPISPSNPLLDVTNCYLTPHMAWTSLAARRRLMNATAANIEAFLKGEPKNVVN